MLSDRAPHSLHEPVAVLVPRMRMQMPCLASPCQAQKQPNTVVSCTWPGEDVCAKFSVRDGLARNAMRAGDRFCTIPAVAAQGGSVQPWCMLGSYKAYQKYGLVDYIIAGRWLLVLDWRLIRAGLTLFHLLIVFILLWNGTCNFMVSRGIGEAAGQP